MIKDTLFFEYISEREGKRIVEDEHGFIIYLIDAAECFIAEMFVKKEARGSTACADLLLRLDAEAKEQDCKIVTGNIHLNAKGASRTIAAAMKCGFLIAAANNNVILISKEI